jgi:hypothetical protein
VESIDEWFIICAAPARAASRNTRDVRAFIAVIIGGTGESRNELVRISETIIGPETRI